MKRFYKDAGIGEAGRGWAVLLDAKAIKTPAKAALELPTKNLARAIAEEWAAQGENVRPQEMPLMRLACTAIDRVMPQISVVVDELAGFGRSDLLCYRADNPADLVERQARLWQPWLDWAAQTLGATMVVTQGVRHVEQGTQALAALRKAVEAFDAFGLSGLHALVTGYGSLILGLAAATGAAPAEVAWAAARCDEAYQEERWGIDPEALKRSRNIKFDIDAALRFVALLKA